jgi:uncharacterized protein YijF (DUF1287 family)
MATSMFRFIFALFLTLSAAAYAQEPSESIRRMLQSAQEQIGTTLYYDSAYTAIPFPGGDVPRERGVCTDVVIRAYRGIGVDLQLLVNQDMRKNFGAYPRAWGLSHPDPNIDHRRVLNLAVFFTRQGAKLPVSKEPGDYKPGDIVTWKLPDGRPHIGLVYHAQSTGRPLVIHNIGAGAQAEDTLFAFEISGHYRYMPAVPQ